MKSQSRQNKTTQNTRTSKITQKQPTNGLRNKSQSPATSPELLALNPEMLRPQDMHNLQQTAGNRAATTIVQAKLLVGSSSDVLEQEADRIATQVMEGDSLTQGVTTQPAQVVTPLVQRSGGGSGIALSGELETRLHASMNSGAPLPGEVRQEMETRFGHDFGAVRLHSGTESQTLNRSLHARAFTRGNNIFLGQRAAHPSSVEGKRLLAHELTHVIQQSGTSAAEAPIQRLSEDEETDLIRALRLRRMDIEPDDTDTIAQYDERLSSVDPNNVKFAQKRIQQRNQELKDIGGRGLATKQINRLDETISSVDPNNVNFADRRIAQRNQERIGIGKMGIAQKRINQQLGRAQAARARQAGLIENVGGHWGTAAVGYVGSALSLGGSISNTVNAFDDTNRTSGYAGSGLGIAGSAVSGISSGIQLAGNMAKVNRARMLMQSKSRAGRMLGQDLLAEGGQGSAESTVGVLGSLAGIGSNISGIFKTADKDNTAADTSNKVLGSVNAGLGILGEGVSLFGTGSKLAGAAQRSKAAGSFTTGDDELKAIAANTKKGQKSTGSFLGNIFKSVANVGSNILGVAGAFTSGATSGYLNLASTIAGGVGAAAGGLQTEIERAQTDKFKKQAGDDAAKLSAKIQSGDADAIRFAKDVLKIPAADELAEDDPETLNELISNRISQFAA